MNQFDLLSGCFPTWLPRRVAVSAVVGALSLSTLADDQLNREAPNNRNSDKPYANPSPKNVLVLKGRKDPRLEILFSATYSTTNPECETVSVPGLIFGAPKVAQTIYDAVRVPPGQFEFSVSVYLDRYLPGKCNWQPISILHLVKNPDLSGRSGHHGLVVIRNNGGKETALSFICSTWTPDANDDKTSMTVCRAVDVHPDNHMSPSGGVVNLQYTLR
jgi:hypothetical protein